MKNTRFAITLIVSALMLSQAGYARAQNEIPGFVEQTQPEAFETPAQPASTPTPACITVNERELADAIRAAIAEALAQRAQKPATEAPKITEHQIARKDKETHIGLDQNSNDTYSVTLHVGDSLIVHTNTGGFSQGRPVTGTWVIDVMTLPLYSGILQYTNMLVAESYPSQDSMYFKAHKEGYTTLKFHYLLPDGTSNTQELNVTVVYAGPPLDGDQPLPTSSNVVPTSEQATSGTE